MQPNNTTYTDRNDQRPNLGGWMHQHWPCLSTSKTDPNDRQSVRWSTKTAKRVWAGMIWKWKTQNGGQIENDCNRHLRHGNDGARSRRDTVVVGVVTPNKQRASGTNKNQKTRGIPVWWGKRTSGASAALLVRLQQWRRVRALILWRRRARTGLGRENWSENTGTARRRRLPRTKHARTERLHPCVSVIRNN